MPSSPLDAREHPVPLRRILSMFAAHRWGLVLAALLVFASAAATLGSPFIIRAIVDDALPNSDTRLLVRLAVGLVAVVLATSVLAVFQSLVTMRIGQAVMHRIRTNVFTHVSSLSLHFFTQTRTGEVQSRIANDVGSMQSVVTNTFTQLVQSIATVLAIVVAMLALDWELALLSFVTLPLAVWLNRKVGAVRRKLTARKQVQKADMTSMVQESLSVSGVLLAKTMGQSELIATRFEQQSSDLADLEVESELAGRWRTTAVQFALAIIPAMTYVVGGFQNIGGNDAITIGTLVAFVALQSQLYSPLVQILKVTVKLHASMALFERIFEYLDLAPEITERPNATNLRRPTGKLECRDVAFTYPDAPAPAVQGLSFVAEPGMTIAIVGHTGSGKSTTSYLLSRMYDVESGGVFIDGVDVRDLTFASLTRAISMVTQETYLLHASIAENIRFGRPTASHAKMVAAAQVAQIHDTITDLPQGYDTIVGERGYRFSGGEKQRLALARTIIRETPILILDEATSALDNATERAMTDALDHSHGQRTTIVIAHRLSTIKNADLILVMDAGRVVEQGTYTELAARGGTFASLVHIAADPLV